MPSKLETLSQKAAENILSHPKSKKIRVISHYDADGITAAAIICKALFRKGYDFHASLMRNPFIQGLKRVDEKEDNELIIFTDLGSGQIDFIEKMDSKSIIIDHHQIVKKETEKNVLQLNANLSKINGNYGGCGASMAFMVAKALDKKNFDLGALALTGATGDKQYIGGYTELNKKILQESLKNNLLEEKTGIKLSGDTIFDSLYYSIDPYYPGISGNKEKIKKSLDKIGINPDSSYDELKQKEKKEINSFLMFKLIKKGCEKNILDTVVRKRFYYKKFNCELEHLADILDACGKGGDRGLALSVALGNKDSFNKALVKEKEFKKEVLNQLVKLEKNGAEEKDFFRYFYSDKSSMTGVVAGIAANFIFDKEKPLLSIVRRNDEIHVSSRGNQHLVKNGLDLGSAMKKASVKLGGQGGGHQIAAGATLPSKKEKEFLDAVNNILSNQIK
ncbi:MAG: DHH family phosphoesterase [Candidatus Thermoplasmatota archaeon]